MKKEKLEKLAAEEHDIWSSWMVYLFSKCTHNNDGSMTIPEWAVKRWSIQIVTKYDCLSEQEKQEYKDVVLDWHNSLEFYLDNDISDIVNKTMNLTIRLNEESQKLGVSIKPNIDDKEDL